MPEDPSYLKEILVGSGLSASIAGYIAACLQKKKLEMEERKRNQSVAAVIDAAKIYDELNLLASRTGCDRALILASSNGGGIPDAGSPLTVSILYEVVRGDGLIPIRPDWQNIPIDEAYVSMLRDLIQKGVYAGCIDDLAPGILKDLYESEGVRFFHVVPVLRTQMKFYYLSIRWDEEMPVNDFTIRTQLSAASHRIEQILSQSQRAKIT